MTSTLSPDAIAYIESMAPSMGLIAISDKLGVRSSRVKNVILALGVEIKRGRRQNPELLKRNECIWKDRESGLTLRAISKIYKISLERVRQIVDDQPSELRKTQGAKPIVRETTTAVKPTPVKRSRKRQRPVAKSAP